MVFVTTDRLSGGFIIENAKRMPKGNIYIIICGSLAALESTKQRLDQSGNNLNTLFILSSGYQLPIRKNIIDVFVDDYSTSNFLFFNSDYPIEKIHDYLKKESYIIGITYFYNQQSKSINKLLNQYPRAATKKLTNLNMYKNTLYKYQYKIFAELFSTAIGNPGGGVEFSFHEQGDSIKLYYYVANKNVR